jgi:hypothetical protein
MLARVPLKGGAVEFLGEANQTEFLVGEKHLYLFRDKQIRPGDFVEEIFRVDPQTHFRSAVGEIPAFSSAWLSRGERYLYFERKQSELPKPRLVLIQGL